MLEIRLNCEHCNKELKPDSTEAMICSFECTFCKSCVDLVLENVCPNCGGGFHQRPVRPSRNLKSDNYLGVYPASDKRVYKPVDVIEHNEFSRKIKGIKPERR